MDVEYGRGYGYEAGVRVALHHQQQQHQQQQQQQHQQQQGYLAHAHPSHLQHPAHSQHPLGHSHPHSHQHQHPHQHQHAHQHAHGHAHANVHPSTTCIPSIIPHGLDPAHVDIRTFYPYQPNEVKHRRRTTRQQLRVLEEVYRTDTKPNGALRKRLAEELGMTPRGVQVSVWFLF